MPLRTKRFYEFGLFRLDVAQRLLFRDRERVELAPKVLDTLILLVENHKDLVTKNELIQKLWPETFVEESNLTFNISTLRKVLGDDRNNGNGFIETIPKRGYRFIAPVRTSDAIAESRGELGPEPKPQDSTSSVSPASRRLWQVGTTVALIAAIFAYSISRHSPSPIVATYQPLTQDTVEKAGPLVTDGLKVYFTESAEGTRTLVSVSTAGGQTAPLVTPRWPNFGIEDIAPGHRELLSVFNDALWSLPVPAGPPRKWGSVPHADWASWFPDGKMLVFSKGRQLYAAKVDGSAPIKIAEAPGSIIGPRVSPDGKRVRFTLVYPGMERQSLWEAWMDGAHQRAMFPNWSLQQCCGNWTPDGRYFFFVAYKDPPNQEKGEIWAVRERASLLRRTRHNPVQLTHSSQRFLSPVSSLDGKQLFAIGEDRRGELMRYDSELRQLVRQFDGLSASWVSFSRDGETIAYERYPDASLWVRHLDGTTEHQLTFGPMIIDGVSLAPEEKQIAFRGQEPGKPYKIRLTSADGSEPQGRELIPGDNKEEGVPTWSPDGTKIAFGDVPQAFGNDDGTHAINIFDLRTQTLSSVPGSKGLWTARWSPDGRYIAALRISIPQNLYLFDFSTGRWHQLCSCYANDPAWSHDSRFIYFTTPGAVIDNSGIFRVRVSDGKKERVAGFGNLRRASDWNGLTPKDEPLFLRDIGTSEIYALDVDWP